MINTVNNKISNLKTNLTQLYQLEKDGKIKVHDAGIDEKMIPKSTQPCSFTASIDANPQNYTYVVYQKEN